MNESEFTYRSRYKCSKSIQLPSGRQCTQEMYTYRSGIFFYQTAIEIGYSLLLFALTESGQPFCLLTKKKFSRKWSTLTHTHTDNVFCKRWIKFVSQKLIRLSAENVRSERFCPRTWDVGNVCCSEHM